MRKTALYPHLGGFESTYIFGSGHDILGTTEHIERWRDDLNLLRDHGILQLRYSLPWHRIERNCNRFDWSWLDGPLHYMRQAGLEPIVDPLHHTSFPGWLIDGFLHPQFPDLYERFLDEVSTRYPYLRRYTVINEPLPTTIFCSYTGMWYPHRASDRDFAQMCIAVACALAKVCRLLKRKNPNLELVHVDTCEHHQAHDRPSENWVAFANQRRFLITDLTLGRVHRHHELYPYLTANGVCADQLRRLQDEPGHIDVLGLDYYIHSEMEWFFDAEQQRSVPIPINQKPIGPAVIAAHYRERYRIPLMLSETNIRGTVAERLRWLKFMESQCEVIAKTSDFRGFCWYPTVDTTDWSNACIRHTGDLDPQGIWLLDPVTKDRIETELSQTYSALAQGSMHWTQIPNYPLSPELAERLRNYRHWIS